MCGERGVGLVDQFQRQRSGTVVGRLLALGLGRSPLVDAVDDLAQRRIGHEILEVGHRDVDRTDVHIGVSAAGGRGADSSDRETILHHHPVCIALGDEPPNEARVGARDTCERER